MRSTAVWPLYRVILQPRMFILVALCYYIDPRVKLNLTVDAYGTSIS